MWNLPRLFYVFDISFAHFKAHISRSAVTYEHGKRERYYRYRKNNIRCAVAKITDAPADKYLIDNIVKRVYDKRDNARYCKF